ncbi:MAG: alpha/beta hydrolase [Crocinitomicaceae bacterium]|nr:alpha/beta hydrolase [Crocinitomicaceae bacterium]
MKTYVVIFCCLLSAVVFANNDRFKSEIFNDVEVETNVLYGSAYTQGGVLEELYMDVYQPVGDTMKERPLVVLGHGGYFFIGDKSDFHEECMALARAGFVAVTIDYRLIDVVDDSFYVAKRAVIDAIADMKASVRYFYKDAATQNKYRINTDNIFIGGYSAGAITSLHYAYANTKEDIIKMGGTPMLEYIQKQGGLEGKSGNPGYPSKIHGVINIAGSLLQADMVDKNEPPLFSIHGTADDIVPYNEGFAGTTKVLTQGSGLIHQRAASIGLNNHLKRLDNMDHFGFLDCNECMSEIMLFLSTLIR